MLSTAVLTGFATHMGYGPGWGGGPVWLFFLIPFFGLLLVVALFAILGRRWRRHGGPGFSGHPGWQAWQAAQAGQADGTRSAEKTLAERFAQGDIDEVEYRARLEVLRANRADPTPGAPLPPQ
ncbi:MULTISPECIES: SHOCT domain-containing protein [Cryobacterium]|nr:MULTISPECIES: hypothetical protein [Cryobacterium]MEB0201457.1 hypothetical protein [Cryobacterium sp. 5I3]